MWLYARNEKSSEQFISIIDTVALSRQSSAYLHYTSNLFIKILILFSHIFGYVHTVFLFIALGHSCINPFIYFWTDARVRFGFLDLIGSIPGVKRCCRGVQWDNNFGRWEQIFFVLFPIWKIWQGRLRRLKKYLKTRESNGV